MGVVGFIAAAVIGDALLGGGGGGGQEQEARPEDLGAILELCWEMHSETAYRKFALNREKAESFVRYILDWDEGFVGVAEIEGLIVGVIVGAIQPFWFSDELEASELLLYVAPSSRGGFVGKRVVELFETWSVARGCSRVVVLGS